MKIDQKIFQYWMGCIGDRCNRVLAEPTYREYYRALSAELTTEQFVEAANRVFRDAEFWPAPRTFIDAVKPSPLLLGAQAFEWIRNHGHHEGCRTFWRAEDIEREVGAAALVAFRSVGGGERFAGLEGADMPFCRREFIESFIRAKEDAGKPPEVRALPPVEQRALPAGV